MIKLFVPGRLCLFGEHTDWAGHYRTMNADIKPGAAIVTGIEQGICAEVEKSSIFEMYSTAGEIDDVWQDFSCRMDEGELKRIAKSGSFFCYCAGVASYMLEWYKVGGVRIRITSMTLPMKSGLSSSAAICVLVARAFNLLYNLNLNTLGEMNIAYLGELRTSSRCGRLDQACAFGVKPNLMTFDGDEIEVRSLNVKKHLYWVFADLCAEKDTIRILSDLNKAYPFPSNEAEKAEHEALGSRNLEIVNRAVNYMAEGKAEELGRLMTEAEALFDAQVAPMSVALWSPKLHAVLNDPVITPMVWGGKGVGSHGDGSVQFLARSEEDQLRLADYLNKQGMKAYTLTLKPVHTVRRAIIPVAGFGTRLYPATRALKKDFFPIPCPDGMVRPVILILLEELVQSGIEEICLVLGSEEERRQYADFFEHPLSDDHLQKLNPEAQEYENRILDIGKRLRYVYQREKRGFGHAVYQAAQFAGNEPVLLLLGDTLYRSDSNKPCALQMVEEYERYNSLLVSIHTVPLSEVSHYGILHGVWEDKERTALSVDVINEKPKPSYAEEFLGVRNNNGEKEYYSVFGQYILTPEVFEQLHLDIMKAEMDKDYSREIELTSALEAVRQHSGMMGVRLKGRMYDMGNPAALVRAVTEFSK
ncbi:UTP-glucose-1-phosphate uridylyltransferase [Prevotella aff. ruminicola Tc2-24]|uniref:UTP--glucose-1-phosphate uridylyltransferase n=1 Tax=Prevotella aff. ruminicola Tc2-24 TaxID=81582 RepID=A0A1I0MGH3_9BACT|nr:MULTISPECIES: sugar phosphate nucleotidyltransferase [Prevotella]SEE11931.1 UTP-glucose-1-phosphate uridylyltransferase [Prevotella sp. lc2012]SEV87389.1 UTP-glucose-1-phosphate uridylyltransferase [Prevotella aff. ruminicola Tc2-24]